MLMISSSCFADLSPSRRSVIWAMLRSGREESRAPVGIPRPAATRPGARTPAAPVLCQPPGRAGVVGMQVGQDHRGWPGGPAEHRLRGILDVLLAAQPADIDERPRRPAADQVDVGGEPASSERDRVDAPGHLRNPQPSLSCPASRSTRIVPCSAGSQLGPDVGGPGIDRCPVAEVAGRPAQLLGGQLQRLPIVGLHLVSSGCRVDPGDPRAEVHQTMKHLRLGRAG